MPESGVSLRGPGDGITGFSLVRLLRPLDRSRPRRDLVRLLRLRLVL